MTRSTFLTILCGATLLTACGGDDDGNPAGPTSDASTGPSSSTGQQATSENDTDAAATTTGTDPSGSTTSPSTAGSSGTSGTEGTDASTGGIEIEVPTEPDDLLPWLEARTYADWEAETTPHPSADHMGQPDVLVYMNEALTGSLLDELAEHPVGAASVKEHFGPDEQIMAWTVLVKTAAQSGDEGQGWYWAMVMDGNVAPAGHGAAECAPCHSAGTDFVLTPYPFEH